MTEAVGRNGQTSIVVGRQAAFRATAFTRAAVLAGLHGHMEAFLWLRLVGEFWTTTEGDKRELVELLRAHEDWAPMMKRRERLVWDDLPDWFRAWRGCYEGYNEGGLSYSMEREEARDYPFVARYRMAGLVPILRCAWVSKLDCIVKMDRGRVEVLAHAVNEIDRVVLDYRVSPMAFAGTPHLPPPARV